MTAPASELEPSRRCYGFLAPGLAPTGNLGFGTTPGQDTRPARMINKGTDTILLGFAALGWLGLACLPAWHAYAELPGNLAWTFGWLGIGLVPALLVVLSRLGPGREDA